MSILLSELYGKHIISTGGEKLGKVEDIIMDFEEGGVASLLTEKIDNLSRSANLQKELRKNSINFKRVKNVSEAIVVGIK